MSYTVDDVREVRERTAFGYGRCKQLLEDWGSVDAAVENCWSKRPRRTRKLDKERVLVQLRAGFDIAKTQEAQTYLADMILFIERGDFDV